MNVVHGDLIQLAKDGYFDVIVHGCNCFHTMGAGIARKIAEKFPEALAADLETSRGDRSKLGTTSFADVCIPDGSALTIVNAYTQFRFGSCVQVDYDAITSCFREIKRKYGRTGVLSIGYPRIGCGLAGGDWDVVSAIINKELEGCNHILVEYD